MSNIFHYLIDPKDIPKAFNNVGLGVNNTFNNRRLGIGFGVSIILYLLIFFFWPRPAPVEEYALTEVSYFDKSYPPKAQPVIPKSGLFQPVALPEDKSIAPIDLTKRMEKTQAVIDLDRYAKVTGLTEVIKVGRKEGLSTEEMLAQAPIELRRAAAAGGGKLGLVGYPGMGAGVPLDLSSGGPPLPRSAPEVSAKKAGGAKIAPTPSQAKMKMGGKLKKLLIRSTMVNPEFPNWARKRGLTNVLVRLRLYVTASGSIRATVVENSSGFPQWDKSVQGTVKRWRCEETIGEWNDWIEFLFMLR